MNDIDAGLDVRECMRGGEDGLPFVLLVQVTMRTAVKRKWCAVHEHAQVVVLVEIGDALLQLVRVEERLCIRNL